MFEKMSEKKSEKMTEKTIDIKKRTYYNSTA